ncbi:putative nuclear fragile X mental retardation-interacting protein [Lupinus albus]|uniref:Putative nuclear fragile X mental retardation-interacting protein n=1 Tax=Lupinus albus TaxID=3870 RepID=A0A6A4NC78_LUPAL|nr:putative nuclear fragile X mental retardation-interacting protein [Lupinus albus]
MSNNNRPSNTQPNFSNAPKHHSLQNNGFGMQNQLQNPNLMMPFMPNMQQPFMNGANHMLPLQNNNHMHFQQGQSLVGLGPQNPMVPLQGQIMQNAPQMNLAQVQSQILAQGIMSMLQQQPNLNMNMPNGQFCAPYPVQNMNQQLPMQMANPSQVVPYGMHPGPRPMFGFTNQMPQAMVPQNPMFSANPQMGLVPGNQVRPHVNQNVNNTNAFSPQQLQRNDNSVLQNPNPVMMSQGNPNINVKANVPNSNWKGSPNQKSKNKPSGEGFQGGFQKSKFHDINNGKRKPGFHKEHRGKGHNNGMAWNSGSTMEHKQERKRTLTYTEQEIEQWREARKKNHPSNNNIQKKQNIDLENSKVIDREVLQKELKEVLAKQAELGVEVAEIPSYYLKDSKSQGPQGEGKNKFTDKRKFDNKFDKKSDRRRGRFGKKRKFEADKDFSKGPSLNKREPTLLEKLLSADIKRDNSHLFQVFRFMVMNSFFKDFHDKPLIYPPVVVTSESVAEEKYLDTRKDVLDGGDERTDQKIVRHNNDNGNDSEDEESDEDENASIVQDGQ